MRGSAFHNKIVEDARVVFRRRQWHVRTEYGYCSHGVTTYLDLFAVKNSFEVGCEVETTARHVVDNAKKAKSAGIKLWIIVPSRKVYGQAERKLASSSLENDKTISLLLLDQLAAKLMAFEIMINRIVGELP
jgi:hypothetical protein